MIKLTKSLLRTLHPDTKICNIRAFYVLNGKELAWAGHTPEIHISEFDSLKKELSKDKSGLRWTGQLVHPIAI